MVTFCKGTNWFDASIPQTMLAPHVEHHYVPSRTASTNTNAIYF